VLAFTHASSRDGLTDRELNMNNLAISDRGFTAVARPIFASPVLRDREKAARVGATMSFKRNDTLLNQGGAATHSYHIVEGVVRQYMLLPDGRRQIIDFLSAGDVLGLTDIGTYDYCVEAVTEVTAIRYSRNSSNFESVDGDNLRSQLCRARSHAVMLGRQTVKERIASFLIQLAERHRGSFTDGFRLDLPMCRQDIADYLGLTLETVCRTIGILKRSRIIEVPNTHQLVLKNISLLRAVAQGDA